MSRLNLAGWVECTEVEGPGKRFALWVQGCLKRCPGCCNPEMLPMEPRHIAQVETVIAWIYHAHQRHGIEGVTFLGGEPMLQAKGLSVIACEGQKLGLSVMTFTGYTLEALKGLALPGAAKLLAHTDVLVAGPYMAQLPDTKRHWAGSANKRFHFLTDRYAPGIEYEPTLSQAVEFRVGQDGRIRMNGWPIPLSQ